MTRTFISKDIIADMDYPGKLVEHKQFLTVLLNVLKRVILLPW